MLTTELLKILRDLLKGRIHWLEIPFFIYWFLFKKGMYKMIFRGRLTEIEKRTPTMFDSSARPWRVTSDPSKMFLGSVFRATDLDAGGFDEGTMFINLRTGEERIVDADGIARKVPANVSGLAGSEI
jgi:hypothetical protein